MFISTQHRARSAAAAMAIDIAPLIDVVFILLIFFLVTATFVRDSGIQVRRPQAAATRALEPTAMRISIAASGAVFAEGQQIELAELEQKVRQFVASHAEGPVIIIPDERVLAGRLVAVMDTARQAGARDVALATRRPESQ